jgi:S-adenosylmethionine:tRNA ribosyltransferase-isomerase
VSRVPEGRRTSDFDYDLPPELIARYPVEERDESRLLVVDRGAGRTSHRRFRDLLELIPPGDALVLNETRVFPARLLGRKPTGAAVEVLLLRPVAAGGEGEGKEEGTAAAPAAGGALWHALVRPGGKLKPGRTVTVADDLQVEIVASEADGTRIVRLVTPLQPAEALARHGRIPLPPYMQRDAEALDADRYQTVYGSRAGSVAAPTAGLHFTPRLLASLEARGVRIVRLLLHVGVGTFRPVEVEDPAAHPMHAEWYDVGAEAAAALNAVRGAGGALWAVGTTVTRTLETVALADGTILAGSGWTSLYIRPPYRFRAVGRLITNFHLPRSTLLMLVAAFGGYDTVMAAYREAVRERYRFYSYGDAMVLI